MGPGSVYSGTIPTRFLTLLAHFIILILLLWDKEENRRRCLVHYDFLTAEYFQQEYILTLALSLSFVIIEFVGFLSGMSMFSTLHCLFSSICHCSAAFSWSISYIDQWDCTIPFYWWIFTFCSTLPFIVEIITLIRFLRRSKY